MNTIVDEQGLINNFPSEPQMYYAEAPNTKEKFNYLIWGVLALTLVVISVFIATSVS